MRFISSPSNINLIIHIRMTHEYLFYIYNPSCFITQQYFIYFVTPFIPALATRSAFNWLFSGFVSFQQGAINFLTLSIFWHHMMVQAYNVYFFFWPSLLISHFYKEPWTFLLKNDIRNQGLNASCACRYVGISFRPTYLPEQNNMCTY